MKTGRRDKGFTLLELIIALALMSGMFLLIVEFFPWINEQLSSSREARDLTQQELSTYISMQHFAHHALSLKKAAQLKGTAELIELTHKSDVRSSPTFRFERVIEKNEKGLFTVVAVDKGSRELLIKDLKQAKFLYRSGAPGQQVWLEAWNQPRQPDAFRLDFQTMTGHEPKRSMVWSLGGNLK